MTQENSMEGLVTFFRVWFAWVCCSHFMKGSCNFSWISDDLFGDFPWLSAPQLAATVRALQEAVTVLPVVQWGMRGGMEHLLVCVTAQVWHERRESKDKYFLLDFSSLSHVPSFHLPFRWLSSYPPMCPCSVLNPCSLWVTSSKFCCSLCWRLRDLALFLTCLLIWIQVWAALPFPSTPSLTELQQTPFLTGCSGSHSVSWRDRISWRWDWGSIRSSTVVFWGNKRNVDYC